MHNLSLNFRRRKKPTHYSLSSRSSNYVGPARIDLHVYRNPDNYKKFMCVILRLTFLSDDHIICDHDDHKCDHVITNVIM